MIELSHTIADPLGFHARPVMLVAAEAAKWKSDVVVSHGRRRANASDPAVMGLQAELGDELTLTIDGPDEGDAAEFIAHVLRGI